MLATEVHRWLISDCNGCSALMVYLPFETPIKLLTIRQPLVCLEASSIPSSPHSISEGVSAYVNRNVSCEAYRLTAKTPRLISNQEPAKSKFVLTFTFDAHDSTIYPIPGIV